MRCRRPQPVPATWSASRAARAAEDRVRRWRDVTTRAVRRAERGRAATRPHWYGEEAPANSLHCAETRSAHLAADGGAPCISSTRCGAPTPRCSDAWGSVANARRARSRLAACLSAAYRAMTGRDRPDRKSRPIAARACPSSAVFSQQRVFLLSFAQQGVTAGNPVSRSQGPRGVVDPLLIQIDAALLDRPARFVLGLGEPGLYHRIDNRGVGALRRRRGNFLRQDVEHARVCAAGLFLAEQDRGRPDDALEHVGAVHPRRNIGGERALGGPPGGIALLLRGQLLDFAARL